MGQKKQPPKHKPPTKDVSTYVDPTIHYKLKVIAAQQGIPLNALTRRILTYYANAYMPSAPMPPLPNVPFASPGSYPGEPMTMPYVDVLANGATNGARSF